MTFCPECLHTQSLMNYFSSPPSFSGKIAGMIRVGEFFAPTRPASIARAPGGLDPMGGNVDYTGGLVPQLRLRESVWAAVQPTPEATIRIRNPDAAQYGWETDGADISGTYAVMQRPLVGAR